MDRRRFLKVAGIAGLSVMAPVAMREGHAGVNRYNGPYWIMVNAGGGWDPTMLCDPKGGDPKDPKAVDHAYLPGAQGMAGGISYAPITYTDNNTQIYSCDAFFKAHYARLMVINGVDTTTNNHDAGTRITWSGQLAEGYPSFAAMVAAAATQAQSLPLAYVSNGGYDVTQGLVSLTRVGSPDALEALAFPNEMNPSDPKAPLYYSSTTLGRIQAAQAARTRALAARTSLPVVNNALNTLYLARGANDGLVALGNELKGVTLATSNDLPGLKGVGGLDDLTNLMQQAQIALLCFKAGVAVSANMAYGGFDTHSNNDTDQTRQMMILLRSLDFLYAQIDAMGLTNQVYVVVGSDFGRTPYYNAGNGKDHWNITSMLLSGPKIPGNKVLGGTDATFTSIPVDPKTLQPSMAGERITSTDVHMALRTLAGLSGGDLDTQFPLTGTVMPLFS